MWFIISTITFLQKLFKFVPDEVPENLRYGIKSMPEEIANMVSHGVGLIFFLLGIPFLLYKSVNSGVDGYLLGNLIFGLSLLMVYTSSTVYHSVFRVRIKQRLRVFDHISIYFLIAGSFTPFLLVYVRTETGNWVLISLWTMVLVGSIFKLFYTHKFKLVSTLAYVSMGALALVVIEPLRLSLPETSHLFLKIGLGSYLLGVPFYLWKRLYHNHLIWHIFVLCGSLSHFIAAWLMV